MATNGCMFVIRFPFLSIEFEWHSHLKRSLTSVSSSRNCRSAQCADQLTAAQLHAAAYCCIVYTLLHTLHATAHSCTQLHAAARCCTPSGYVLPHITGPAACNCCYTLLYTLQCTVQRATRYCTLHASTCCVTLHATAYSWYCMLHGTTHCTIPHAARHWTQYDTVRRTALHAAQHCSTTHYTLLSFQFVAPPRALDTARYCMALCNTRILLQRGCCTLHATAPHR